MVIIGIVLNLIENIEFVLRPDHHLIRNSGLLHVLQGTDGNITGILVKRPVIGQVDDPDVAYNRESG